MAGRTRGYHDDARATQARPPPLPGRFPFDAPRLRDPLPRVPGDARTRRARGRDRARDPGALHAASAPPGFRSLERPHLGRRALHPPQNEHPLARRGRGRHRDREQVPAPLEREARLQPHEPRHRARGRIDRPGLVLTGPLGLRADRGVPRGLPRRTRREPGRAKRRGVRLRRGVRGDPLRARGLARPAVGRPDPPARKRRAPPIHLLHDQRSQDDAERARRARPLRRGRGARRRLRRLRSLQTGRPHLVARGPLSPGPALGPHLPRAAVRMDAPDRRGPRERRHP